MLFLLELSIAKLTGGTLGSDRRRVRSPVNGSTLITSAPVMAMRSGHQGHCRIWVRSITRMPV